MTPLVSLINISKVYANDEIIFQALKDVNLEIKKGEFVAISGPSGSGKSTLMHIIGLLDQLTSGKYLLEGSDVSKLAENSLAKLRNKKIGFVFQSFNLLSRTSALKNVALPLVYSGIDQVTRDAKAKEALESVGLADKLDSVPNQLSGGQQQRVAIARALVTNPEIILADEPTGNLDTKSGEEIIALFNKLNKEGRTVVLITHELNIAKSARRVVHVKDGKVS